MPKVLVPLAQGCEELEAVTVIDLLRRAGIEVITAGLDAQPVTASRGVRLIPDTKLDDVLEDSFDLIVLPGGLPGADHLDNDPRIRALLIQQAQDNKKVAAICAAPKVLASAGLLKNKRATAYPGTLENLNLPHTEISSINLLMDGNVTTSRGPGTAMDFALNLIEQLVNKDKRDEVETGLVR
jgi:4-methyl-5(b-hydroxyethyl)-thiazole monophosphate biosynthesis